MASIDLSVDKRADELGYDAARKVVAIIANLIFPEATDGIEVPSWNSQDGNWYLSIPSTISNPRGEIAVIDPKAFKVLKTFAEPPCNSAGTAFGAPHSHTLFLGCSQNSYLEYNNTASYIISTSSGKVESTVRDIVGSDQIAYSQNLNLFFASAARNRATDGSPGPILAVVDAERGNVVQRIATDNVTAHAVAVDEVSNRVFVPLLHGIAVYDYHHHQTSN
ncbi:hypothetical protein BDZ45DRAFT_685498 [Acephala macrosclerotiorum]|nr:hypothetical protein BDZ45DRAFT_685498 [Acephala macrosclerotiorum]